MELKLEKHKDYILSEIDNILLMYSMYDNSELHLNRKYEKFISFIEEKCQDKTISSPS